MQNFMQCSHMIFGSRVRFCICYKEHQRSFDVYTRKYAHSFMDTVVDDDYSRSRALIVPSMNAFLVSDGCKIKFFDCNKFKEYQESEIEVRVSANVAG